MREREAMEDETACVLSHNISQALLYTTMSIIGLPVEVYIKDGSVYSGFFFTASFHLGYGIALKKARMIKKGTQNTNVQMGALINTLVISPEDLVQVVAKGVMLPSDIAYCDDEEAALGTPDSSQGSENGALGSKFINQERQVMVGSPQDVENSFYHHSESMHEVAQVHGSNTSINGQSTKVNLCEEDHNVLASDLLANGSPSVTDATMKLKLMNQFHNSQLLKESISTQAVVPEVSSSVKAESDAPHSSLVGPVETSLPQNQLINKTVKDSKLNPCAEVFSPTIPNVRTTPPLVPTVASIAYVANSIPAVHVAAAQPEVGVRPIVQRSSWPVKIVPYANSSPTNANNGLQYVPSIAGHIASRAQPIRQGPQYQPIQVVPPYIHTNPQNAMFGRPNQVVYVHPVAQDVIQAPTALPQTPHPLMTSHQFHVRKHEGAFVSQPLQVSVTHPLVANVPQPIAMSNHIQRSQPVYSSLHPVPVLGSNVVYGAKFP